MDGVLEFHGRLSRVDKRPANPGAYCLQFQLHGHQKGGGKRDRVYWEETLDNIQVAAGGFYRVILGRKAPVPAKIFSNGPRWMSIRVVRGGRLDVESGNRVPVIGQHLRLGTALEKTGDRLSSLEDRVNTVASAAPRVEQFQTRMNRLGENIAALQARILGLEDSTEHRAIIRRIEALTDRLDTIDKDEGRLDRIESEVEDLVGPDGDVVDLNDRMDRIEGRAPDLIKQLRARERDAPQQLQLQELHGVIELLKIHVAELELTVQELQENSSGAAKMDELTPEALGAVRRAGDAMTGGLTINRGGLEVLSGGVACRGATVTTLDASNVVKAPKMIAEAFELRGDFTVDSAKRVLQVRHIDGRQASARRDGALHLNARGGSEVVIGNQKSSRGAQVHGSVRADSLVSQSTGGLAQLFKATGDLKVGDVVRVNDAGERVVRVRKTGDPRVVGVVTNDPGILLGGENRSGVVSVAIGGVVMCRVDATAGPIRAGDLLIAGTVTGHACRSEDPAPGTVLGKALGARLKGRGMIPVLLGAR